MNANNGMRPVHPGEIPARGTRRTRAVGQCAGQGARSAGQQGDHDSQRPEGRQRRYCATAGQVFRDYAATLVESAEDLGASPDGDRGWPRDCGASHAPARGGVEKRPPMPALSRTSISNSARCLAMSILLAVALLPLRPGVQQQARIQRARPAASSVPSSTARPPLRWRMPE